MIIPFESTVLFTGINVELGLLTQPHIDPSTGAIEPHRYILALCDWCGHREIIDDPRPSDAPKGYNDETDVVTRQRFHARMRVTLGWVEWSERIFCCEKCRREALRA